MPQKKPNPKGKSPSFGVLTVIENGDDIRLSVEIEQNPNSSDDIMDRIRAVISGMIYVYDKDRSAIEALGQAYIDGVETGIRNAPGAASPEETTGMSMGFFSS